MENPAPSLRHAGFTLDGVAYTHIDMAGMYGPDYHRLPVVLRLLLENALRNMRGAERDAAVAALFAWLADGTSEAEIAFQPGRVLMHDTTSTPALVDIAAMRDALDEAGVDPRALNPVLPVDVSVDHSLAVQAYAQPDAAARNLALEPVSYTHLDVYKRQAMSGATRRCTCRCSTATWWCGAASTGCAITACCR